MAGMNNPLQNSLKQLGINNPQQQQSQLPWANGFQPSWEDKALGWLNPVGDAIGAIGGGLEDIFGERLFGKPEQWNQRSTQTPIQRQWAEQQMQNSMDAPKPQWDPLEKFVRQNYQQKSIPSLMSRIGRLNGMNTGAGRQMMAQADVDFENQLGAMKSDWERGNRQDLNRNAMTAFQQPAFYDEHQQKQEGAAWPIMMAALSGATGGGAGMGTNAIAEFIKQLMQQQNQQPTGESQYGNSFSIPNKQNDNWNNPNNLLASLYQRRPSLMPNPQPF